MYYICRILSHFKASEMAKSQELPGAPLPGPAGGLTAPPDPQLFGAMTDVIACMPTACYVGIFKISLFLFYQCWHVCKHASRTCKELIIRTF